MGTCLSQQGESRFRQSKEKRNRRPGRSHTVRVGHSHKDREEARDCDFYEELDLDDAQDDESPESGVNSTLDRMASVGDQPLDGPRDEDSEFPTEDWEMLEGEQRGTTIDQALKSLRIKRHQ